MSARAPETLQRLKDQDWEILLKRIEDKKCTPILGTETRSEVLNLRTEIAKEWAHQYGYPRLEGVLNLARVARFISVNYDADFTKRELIRRLEKVPSPNFDDPNNPYNALARLPLPVYITTNYDDYMFRALVKANRDVKREMCRWNKQIADPPSIFPDFNPTVANPVVFHFHGLTDELDSLVLTEDDYFEFLINVSKDHELIPPRIEKAMTGSSLLLLGYRLDDWDFRVMFHLLASYLEISTSRTHVAVQVAPVEDQEPEEQKRKARDYLDLYFEKYKKLDIRIYWGTCRDFMSDLSDRWTKRYADQ